MNTTEENAAALLLEEKYQAGLASYQGQAADLKKQIDALEQTRAEIGADIDRLQAEKTKFEAYINAAQDAILSAGREAQDIISEATRVCAEKVDAVNKEAESRQAALDKSAASLTESIAKFEAEKAEYFAKVEDLAGRETLLLGAEAKNRTRENYLNKSQSEQEAEKIRLAGLKDSLIQKEKELADQNARIETAKNNLARERVIFKNEYAEFEVALDEMTKTVEGLRNLDAEREKFKQEKLEFGTVRDQLLAREILLDQFDAQLKNQQNDLKQREKIFAESVNKGA